MKIFTKLFIFITMISLVSINPNVYSESGIYYRHRIAGYGPVAGEYIYPVAIQFFNQKIYILDQYGISITDQVTRHLESKFPVKQDLMDTKQKWNDKKSWIELIRNIKTGLAGNRDPNNQKNLTLYGVGNSSLLDPKICFDSAGNLYVSGNNTINIYNPSTGDLLNTLALPQINQALNDTEHVTFFSFKIYNDRIFLLESKSFLYPLEDNFLVKMYILSLTGNLEKEIEFKINSEESIFMDANDFVYVKDPGFIGLSISTRGKQERCQIQFFSMDGLEITTKGNFDKMLPMGIEIQEPGRLLIAGRNKSPMFKDSTHTQIQVINLKINEDNSIDLLKDSLIISQKLGALDFDLASDGKEIGIITSGSYESMLDFRAYHIVEEEIQRLGSFSNKEGQIFGSIASTVDAKGNLYETSLGNNFINIYDKYGKYVSQIKLDLREISSFYSDFTIFPTMIGMEINGDLLYGMNLNPNTISFYSFKENTWHRIYEDFNTFKLPLWFSPVFYNDRLYLLDSGSLLNDSPHVSYLIENNTLLDVSFARSPSINKEEPPLFTDMIINETEMMFLDCIYNEIWIYNRTDEAFKEKIKLYGVSNSFFSSFDEFKDGTLMLCDAANSRLLHISKKGEILDSIGKEGIISTGNTKEDYETRREDFYHPIQLKIVGDLIYVSDFMNCRYHILAPEEKPELVWNEEEVLLEDYLISEQNTVTIQFQKVSSRDFSYLLTSSAPFIKIDKSSGMVSENKISFIVLGDKLNAWETHKGSIKITFPDYPFLNKEIPITVKAVGKIVKLQIGSNKAFFNGKETELDKGSIPQIKGSRTFVGLRFLGETIFNAKVSYEAKTKTVLFELNSKKIELYIDKPYALVNGTRINLDAPPFIKEGRTLVPLRFISENLEASVEYDGKTRTITIFYPKKSI